MTLEIPKTDTSIIEVMMGTVELHSLFRMEGWRLYGVGVAIHRDYYGKISKVDISDSGTSMELPL